MEKDHSKPVHLANDQFYGETFDYALSDLNPSIQSRLEKDKDVVTREGNEDLGRFVPHWAVSLMANYSGGHLVSNHETKVGDGGGVPQWLTTAGDAGSGEREIRRYY